MGLTLESQWVYRGLSLSTLSTLLVMEYLGFSIYVIESFTRYSNLKGYNILKYKKNVMHK